MPSLSSAVFGILLVASSATQQAVVSSTCSSADDGALAKLTTAVDDAFNAVTSPGVVHAVDLTMAAVGIGAGVAVLAGVGGPVVVVAGTAALAWNAGRSVTTLVARAVRHQTLDPIADAGARGAWIGLATVALGAGAFAANARVAADLVVVQRDLALARMLRTAAMAGGAAATVDSGVQTTVDWRRLDTLDRAAAIGQIAFWSGVTVVDAYGNATPESTVATPRRSGAAPTSAASAPSSAPPPPGIAYAEIPAKVAGPAGPALAAMVAHVNDVGGDRNCVSVAIATDLTLGGEPASAKKTIPPELTRSRHRALPTPDQAAADAQGSAVTGTLADRYGLGRWNIVDESEISNLASIGPWMDEHGVTRGIVVAIPPGNAMGHVFNVVRVGDVIYAIDGQAGITVPIDVLSSALHPRNAHFRFFPTADTRTAPVRLLPIR